MKSDGLAFFLTLLLIGLAHYIGGYSEILSGHVLAQLTTANLQSVRELAGPRLLCHTLLDCQSDEDARYMAV